MAKSSPGTNLSHYRIVFKIGAGGMGEVYHLNELESSIAFFRGTLSLKFGNQP